MWYMRKCLSIKVLLQIRDRDCTAMATTCSTSECSISSFVSSSILSTSSDHSWQVALSSTIPPEKETQNWLQPIASRLEGNEEPSSKDASSWSQARYTKAKNESISRQKAVRSKWKHTGFNAHFYLWMSNFYICSCCIFYSCILAY